MSMTYLFLVTMGLLAAALIVVGAYNLLRK